MYGAAGDPERSKITLNQVDVSPLPVGEGQIQSANCLGGWNMLISASSEMQDEAWAFVQFMTSDESHKKYSITASTLPTLKTLYDHREILEKVPVVDLSKEALQNASPVQFRPTTRRCLPRWPSSSTTSLEALSHLELPSSLSRATYSGSSSRANKPSQTEASPRIPLTLRHCRPYAPWVCSDSGMAPIWRIISRASQLFQFSTILPPEMRSMLIPLTSILLPDGGTPMNSP